MLQEGATIDRSIDATPAAARVAAARPLAPSVRHLTLAAPGALAAARAGAEAAVRFVHDGREHERRYSVFRADPDAGTIEICVVLHGLGPGSLWAAGAAPGDRVELAVSKAVPIELAARAQAHVFLGDETSVAGAETLMRAVPAGLEARAVFEIGSPEFRWPAAELARPGSVAWVARDGRPGAALASWLLDAPLPRAARVAAYVTGETWLCSAVAGRLFRERGFPRGAVRALPFWRWRRSAQD